MMCDKCKRPVGTRRGQCAREIKTGAVVYDELECEEARAERAEAKLARAREALVDAACVRADGDGGSFACDGMRWDDGVVYADHAMPRDEWCSRCTALAEVDRG